MVWSLKGCFFCCLFASFIAGISWCQEIRASADAFPMKCYIGDLIRYRVTVFAPKQVRVIFPSPQRIGEFEVRRHYPVQHQRGELPGMRVTIAEWDIALYRTGKAVIPPLTIHCQGGGQTTLVKTNPVEIEVLSLLPPNARKPRPLKSPLPYPLSPFGMALVFLTTLLALAVLWAVGRGALWLAQTAWAHLQKVAVPPPLPPHRLALQAIDRAERLYRRGQIERAFLVLSYALRRYLRDRFRVAALELPTNAVIRHLQTDFTGDWLKVLRFTLDLSDLIKFARYAPTEEEATRLFDSARQIVHESERFFSPSGDSSPRSSQGL